MRFSRSLSACLVFATSTTLAFGQSNDADNEPQLGPIIVLGVDTSDTGAPRLLPAEAELGPIVPIAAYVEVDTNSSKYAANDRIKSENEIRIEKSLKKRISLHEDNVPFVEFIRKIKAVADINIVLDEAAMERVGVSSDSAVSIDVDGIQVKSALKLILQRFDLAYTVDNEVLKITNARVQLVSSEVESHLPSSLPLGIETIRIIGKPTAAPIEEPITTGVTTTTVAVNPEQIRFHLTEAAKHLESAGLSDEAQKIHDIQQQIQREHHQRLLTAYLKSTFVAVEAEIALLKASIPLFGCKFGDVSHEAKASSDK